jgi:hypothetical protein
MHHAQSTVHILLLGSTVKKWMPDKIQRGSQVVEQQIPVILIGAVKPFPGWVSATGRTCRVDNLKLSACRAKQQLANR